MFDQNYFVNVLFDDFVEHDYEQLKESKDDMNLSIDILFDAIKTGVVDDDDYMDYICTLKHAAMKHGYLAGFQAAKSFFKP